MRTKVRSTSNNILSSPLSEAENFEDSGELLEARSNDEESGYTLPLTALLLIPLLVFSAFAIDVGAWYLKGQQVQRASDAAALAGVIHMPNLAEARVAALDVAAKNGLVDQEWLDAGNAGVANAKVEVTPKGDQLRVRIDTKTPAYLGKVVLDEVAVERYSVADIASEVGFRSPSSGLGTGNLGEDVLGTPPGGGSYANGFWLGIRAHCSTRVHGDPFSPLNETAGNSGFGCVSEFRSPNPSFAPEQDKFIYVADIPLGISGTTDIQVFEPGACTAATAGAREEGEIGTPRLQFRVYASDGTPEYDDDNLAQAPMFDYVFPADACTGGQDGWYTLASVPAAEAGRWYVRVNSRINNDLTETGHNNFALRAVPSGGDGKLCSRSAADPTCPTLYAKDWLAFYRPPWNDGGVPTEFFLTQVGEEHAGKVLEIKIFDPGEGMNDIQFINDKDESVDFTFKLTNCSVGNDCAKPEDTEPQPSSSCDGKSCLLVTERRFNNNFLTVRHKLPSDYTCAASCWFRVQYNPEGDKKVSDFTTWSVNVIGDPAHLTE